MSYFSKLTTTMTGLVAALGVILTAPALAGPIIHNGATFQVVATAVEPNTVDFHYTADFSAPGWMGSGLDYIFAIDFKFGNYTISSIESFSTTADNAEWAATFGPSNATGCQGGNKTFGCAQDNPFDEEMGTLTAGVIAWDFRVIFTTNVDTDDFALENNHIGAFFQRCYFTRNPNDGDARRCKKGLGLSKTVSFGPGPDPDPPNGVPVPGTLALLGLGLLTMRVSRRARLS